MGPIKRRIVETIASVIGSSGFSPIVRAMPSMTTIASSMIRPTAIAKPPTLMMFNVCPKAASASTAIAIADGTTMAAAAVMRKSRRKKKMTAIASNAPTRIASRKLACESTISVVWSQYGVIFMSPGSRAPIAASRAFTSPPMRTTSACGDANALITTAGRPS